MSKYSAIIILGILVTVLPVLGFPAWMRTTLFVLSGLSIAVLGYLSSVVYCSNCKKLIEDADQALPTPSENTPTTVS